MRCLIPTWLLLALLSGCRATLPTKVAVGRPKVAVPSEKAIPLAPGDRYACVLNSRGQGQCLGIEVNASEAPAGWQTLRAAASTPVLRSLVARASVACAVAVKPPSLENRILCWQPQSVRTPSRADQDAILLSGKMPAAIRALALQKDKVCALLGDGQVGCALLGTTERALTFQPVKGLRSIRQIRSGASFSCGVRSDTGAIFCWGDNSAGQLGLGSAARSEEDPIAIAGFPGFATTVDAGTLHACAINAAGEVLCWGTNGDEQLGVQGEKFLEPQPVRGLPAKAHVLALGSQHSCAQLVDGAVWCWGRRGALGSETQGGLIPVRVPLPVASAQLVAAADRTCSQLTTGEFFCWGSEPEIFPLPPL